MPRKATRTVSNGVVVNPTSVSIPNTSAIPDIYSSNTDRDLKILMDRAVTESDWVMVFKTALDMSLGGGMIAVKAMEFLARYRWGMPPTMTIAADNANAQITIVEVIRPQAISSAPEQLTVGKPTKPDDWDDKLDKDVTEPKDSDVPF